MKKKISFRGVVLLRSLLGILAALCIIAVIAFVDGPSKMAMILLGAGFAIWLAVFLLWVFLWRCPECGRILPRVKGAHMPDSVSCHHCDTDVDLTKKDKATEDGALS